MSCFAHRMYYRPKIPFIDGHCRALESFPASKNVGTSLSYILLHMLRSPYGRLHSSDATLLSLYRLDERTDERKKDHHYRTCHAFMTRIPPDSISASELDLESWVFSPLVVTWQVVASLRGNSCSLKRRNGRVAAVAAAAWAAESLDGYSLTGGVLEATLAPDKQGNSLRSAGRAIGSEAVQMASVGSRIDHM